MSLSLKFALCHACNFLERNIESSREFLPEERRKEPNSIEYHIQSSKLLVMFDNARGVKHVKEILSIKLCMNG